MLAAVVVLAPTTGASTVVMCLWICPVPQAVDRRRFRHSGRPDAACQYVARIARLRGRRRSRALGAPSAGSRRVSPCHYAGACQSEMLLMPPGAHGAGGAVVTGRLARTTRAPWRLPGTPDQPHGTPENRQDPPPRIRSDSAGRTPYPSDPRLPEPGSRLDALSTYGPIWICGSSVAFIARKQGHKHFGILAASAQRTVGASASLPLSPSARQYGQPGRDGRVNPTGRCPVAP
jgi:hypothetical protein